MNDPIRETQLSDMWANAAEEPEQVGFPVLRGHFQMVSLWFKISYIAPCIFVWVLHFLPITHEFTFQNAQMLC